MDHSRRSQAFRPKRAAPGPPRAEAHSDRMDAVLEVLRKGKRFLVCSHARPDGDAVGSMLAMGMFIEQMGKHADLVMADRIPNIYCRLPGAEEIRVTQIVNGSYDAVILLECDGLERTGVSGLEQLFKINIDHHASGHEYANVNWIDRDASSVGELVHRLVKAAGARITPDMAHCLYTTVLTDTGLLLRINAGLDIWNGAGTGGGRGRPCPDCAGRLFFHAGIEIALAGRGAHQFESRRAAGVAVGDARGRVALLRQR